jgi:localization factor PodJL
MAQSLPWSVKGIDADTRDAAREAARRAGMSVSDWLEHVIREETRKTHAANARSTGQDIDDRLERSRPDTDIGTRLRRLARSGSETAMERGLDRSVDRDAGRSRMTQGPRDEFDALLDHAAKLESRTRDQEIKTANALESIVGWIEKAESRMAASERVSAERQERATSVIADAIKTVSSRVSDVERRATARTHPSSGQAASDQPAAATRRPILSRDGLASAISDIQGRRRELDEPGSRPRPTAVMQNLREDQPGNLRDDLNRIAGLPHGERRSGERRADVTPLMNSLRADLAQLRQDISSIAAQPASSKLEDSIRDLAARLESRTPAALDELARPLARIEAELSRLQAQDPGQRFGRIESEIQRLGDRIENLASTTHEPRLLAAAVQELTGLKDALQRNNPSPRFDDLSSQIATLAHDMGRVREEITRASPANEVESAIEDMREALMRETRDANGIGHGLLTRIAQQLETVSSAVTQVSHAGSMPAGLADADRQQLALLSHKLDQLAQRTQPESDALAHRIEDLAIKLDDMTERSSPELVARVERLSDQIGLLASRGPAAIEKQIDALSARIETLAKAQTNIVMPKGATKVDLAPIEDMIGDLARRLEEVARPEHNPTGLQALETQIAALAERLDSKPAAPARHDGLDATLQDLMRSLGGLRDETASAVDRAARAAVADAMTRAPVHSDGPALSSIRDDLAGLKDVHVSIDRRTSSAIGAVNDTLEKIVERLAQLEDGISRERATDEPAYPSQPESVRQPRMRGGHEPRFDAGEDRSRVDVTSPEPAMATSSREMVASLQRTMRQPAVSQSAMAQPNPSPSRQLHDFGADTLPDLPLEPGSGRPRGRSETPPATTQGAPAGSINPNLIAAARRAAVAASAEAEALKSEDRKAGKGGRLPRLAWPASLKETLEKRRKPILLGLAAIVLAMGAGQIATSMLSDTPRSDLARTEPARTEPARAEASRAEQPAEAATNDPRKTSNADVPRGETTAPASAPALPKDQTSLATPPDAPSAGAPGNAGAAETTGSVKPAAGDMAALAPANAAPDPTRFSVAPGPVTNLGDLPSTLGTAGLRRAAQEGNANAVYELGVRATDGVGMTRDHKLALRLFERAAAAGSGPAQFRLGNMHEKGIGTARDAKLAVTWYRRAAEKGNAKAMHNLAVLIAEGADGKPDYSDAARLFRRAAEFGVRDSQFNLAILLGRGLGVEQDLLQSYTWFAVAARQGDADAGSKRDEVGAKLSAADLGAARNASLAWKAKTPDPVANEVAAPADGWDPAQRQPQPQPRTPPKQRAT